MFAPFRMEVEITKGKKSAGSSKEPAPHLIGLRYGRILANLLRDLPEFLDLFFVVQSIHYVNIKTDQIHIGL